MPEPAKKKQRFEVHTQAALQGVRIVPQSARADASKDGLSGSPAQPHSQVPETNLVEKLIDFFKTME